MDCPHVTLDLSHTAVSGSDALAMAADLGGRLAHVHMADGTGIPKDEHLVPGRGTQPCAPLLRKLATSGYSGIVVLEVNTRRASAARTGSPTWPRRSTSPAATSPRPRRAAPASGARAMLGVSGRS